MEGRKKRTVEAVGKEDWRGSGFNDYLVSIQYVQDNIAVFAKKTRISKTSVTFRMILSERSKVEDKIRNKKQPGSDAGHPRYHACAHAGKSHQIQGEEGTGESFVELDIKEKAGL